MKFKQIWMVLLGVLVCGMVGLSGCGGSGGGGEGNGAVDSLPSVDTSTVEGKIKRLSEMIQRSPKSWDLWYQRSELWYEQGNTVQAMADIDRAIQLHVSNPDGYHLRGFYYYIQNKDSAALRDLRRAAEMGSMNPETFYMIGQLHFFRKDYKQALQGYNNAIKLDSTVATYYFARGFLYQTEGKTDTAIEEYKEALAWDPKFIKVLLVLHDLYLDVKKDADQAYAFNDRILKIDSLHPVGRFNQGNFFLTRANNITDEKREVDFTVLVKLAISEYSQCLQRDNRFVKAYYNRGYCYYLIENYPRALADFTQVIELDPFNAKAFFMKASIQEFEGDLESALANYEQAVSLDANFSDAAKAVKELKTKVKAGEGGKK